MRIWDIPCGWLCSRHLVAEHKELHQIWDNYTKKESAWKHHPETKRWKGKLKALFKRHEEQVAEAKRRGWPMGLDHKSPLDKKKATGKAEQDVFLQTPEEQVKILIAKGCGCRWLAWA